MFRKLYWVAEQVDAAGNSKVTGIFTSIQDLVEVNFHSDNGGKASRITLSKLDCANGVLGSWTIGKHQSLAEDLQAYVQTKEFSLEECELLVNAVNGSA